MKALKSLGITTYVQDGTCIIWGIRGSLMGEVLSILTPQREIIPCIVVNLEHDNIKAVILKSENQVQNNYYVCSSNLLVGVSMDFTKVGGVFDALGGNKLLTDEVSNRSTLAYKRLDIKAPGILARGSIHEPLETGIRAIDSMFPIGRGQRELIIGDRQTGKTSLTLDTILNQVNISMYNINYTTMFCVYCAIGQKQSSIANIVSEFDTIWDATEISLFISSSSSDPASLQYLTPFTGTAKAEYFRDQGEHALIIHDDLTKHAAAYRQISLILRRPPGREAYPGDVFYLHSRLLERAAKMSTVYGSGSLTCLPIIETQLGDVSAYIPTNVISITDGQIFLESKLFNTGIRPAINIGLSVSRVGSMAQLPLLKTVSGKIKLDMANFREVEGFSFLGSDLDAVTLFTVTRGLTLQELLKQGRKSTPPLEHNILLIQSAMVGQLDKIYMQSGIDLVKNYISFSQFIFELCHLETYINKYATKTELKNMSVMLDHTYALFKNSLCQ